MTTSGTVVFVGAGPGDPKLLTIKGMEALRRADVVVYDRLANPQLLQHARRDARFIYCGKEADHHTLPQEEINCLLVREAKQGRTVVRLKGGDPSIFGRVGEEAEECRRHGVPFEIVPGITSGIAAPLYAGIPLTHREYNSSVAFLTGHQCEKNADSGIDWGKVAGVETLVIYMGVKNLPRIQEQLLRCGKLPTTPVALVRWGTLGEQQTLVGTLGDIAQKAREAKFAAPAIIVVGEVVALRESLNWHETRPLFGQKIIYASLSPAGEGHSLLLERLGAEVFTVPVALSPVDAGSFEAGSAGWDKYQWLVFADRWQVEFFFRLLRIQNMDIRQVRGRVAALGEPAAEALEERGLRVEQRLPAELSLPAIRKRLSLERGDQVLYLRYGSTGVRQISDGVVWTYASLYECALDLAHPAVNGLDRLRFDWLVAADQPSLEALIPFNREDGQARALICIGRKTVERAKSLGWNNIVEIREGDGFTAEALTKWLQGDAARSTIKEGAYEVVIRNGHG
jgi:uroporphyrinogen III methyltransferase/synthase